MTKEDEEILKKVDKVLELKREIEELEKDERVKRIVFTKEKWERDYYNDIACAKYEALERIVLNSFKMGNTIEQTSMLTGLSKEKLQKIKRKIKR